MPDRLPLSLKSYDTVTVKLPVGEDIVANTPPGKKVTARLRFRISRLAEEDDVFVRFNGHSLDTSKPVEPLTDKPASALFEVDIDPKLVQPGYNPIDVQMTTFRDVGNQVVLDFLELVVNYK